MKRVLLLALLFCFSFVQAYEITVYGRNSCGFTANLRSELDAAKVPYSYCNIDSSGCLGQLFSVALEFNLAVNGQVNLPVVLVVFDGVRHGYVRPTIDQILKVTAIDDVKAILSVYPNPSSDIIHVSGDAEIYDLTGKCVVKSHDRHISISALPQGIYFVRVGNKTTKITKQ